MLFDRILGFRSSIQGIPVDSSFAMFPVKFLELRYILGFFIALSNLQRSRYNEQAILDG